MNFFRAFVARRRLFNFPGGASRLRRNAKWMGCLTFSSAIWAFGFNSAGLPSVTPLHQGAISYFDGACAHCHGPYGSGYGAGFFAKYDLKQLSKSIEDMANGPGQSPLDAEGLQAQVAFHQAIILNAPFIDWTARQGDTMSGEVTRKASVSANVHGAAVPVTVSGTHWSLTLPAGASSSDLTVTAALKGKTAVWRPTNFPFSVPPKWRPTPVK